MAADTSGARHRLQVDGRSVTAVRERIERKLGIETETRPEGDKWAIYFHAPADVDLDFLRPDVLPPTDWTPRNEFSRSGRLL